MVCGDYVVFFDDDDIVYFEYYVMFVVVFGVGVRVVYSDVVVVVYVFDDGWIEVFWSIFYSCMFDLDFLYFENYILFYMLFVEC